jgi:hypothetical protein
MEFFIGKETTFPLLKMAILNDGINNSRDFVNLLETATITFSMVNIATGIIKISNKRAYITQKILIEPNAPTEYYLYYKFSKKDTNKVGRYVGQFLIKTDDGVLIAPLREELYINVKEIQ